MRDDHEREKRKEKREKRKEKEKGYKKNYEDVMEIVVKSDNSIKEVEGTMTAENGEVRE
jgi:hypothetical protein